MVRTTHHAVLLMAAVAGLGVVPDTRARAAESRANRPATIVAQSTKATAGTGRRPLSERIAASNLPHRSPPAPQPVTDDASLDAETPPPDDAPIPQPPEPAPSDWVAEPAVTETDAELVEAEALPDVVAPEPDALLVVAAPEPESIETEPVIAETEDAEIVTAEINPTEIIPAEIEAVEAEAVAAAVMPTPPQPQAKPSALVRKKLLRRIQGAFMPRPRATAGAVPPARVTPSHAAPAPEAMAAPARLEFDVRESRSIVGEGEQIVMRIAVRNVGGETAERVTTTLFFADGIEPVQAIGHTAEVFPGEVRFATVPELSPGSSVDLLVTAVGTRPGSVAYRGELACGQLAGLIAREGAVTVQQRRAPAP